MQSSAEDVWYLKEMNFNSRKLKVITQNFNGSVRIHGMLTARAHI
jgi:hypothetical protein